MHQDTTKRPRQNIVTVPLVISIAPVRCRSYACYFLVKPLCNEHLDFSIILVRKYG